jgi:hypothetical protein
MPKLSAKESRNSGLLQVFGPLGFELGPIPMPCEANLLMKHGVYATYSGLYVQRYRSVSAHLHRMFEASRCHAQRILFQPLTRRARRVNSKLAKCATGDYQRGGIFHY